MLTFTAFFIIKKLKMHHFWLGRLSKRSRVLRFRLWQGFPPLPARRSSGFDGEFGGPKGGLSDG